MKYISSQNTIISPTPAIFTAILHLLIFLAFFINFQPKISQQNILTINFLTDISQKNSAKNLPNPVKNFDNSHQKSAQNSKENQSYVEPIFNAENLNNPAPLYPALAKQRGIQGKLLIEVVVSKNGEALSVKIASSSGSNLLDESALEAVKNWRFIPAKKFGEFVQATVFVPIQFKIVE